MVRGNQITGKLALGIYRSRTSIVDVTGNRIDRVGDKKWCVYIDSLQAIAVRNNDLFNCTLPGYYRIWSLQRSQARISDNRGANDTPSIERDADGIDDKARC